MAKRKSTKKAATPKKAGRKSRRTKKAEPGAKKTYGAAEIGKIAAIAEQMVDAPAGSLPPVAGSRVRIWKQDPTVSGIAVRDAYIHTNIAAGPSDSQISIKELPVVHPDSDGNYLFPSSSVESFDAVHTYAIVRQVLTMYQRVLQEKMKWQWNTGSNTDPIKVFPHAGETMNAFYSRSDRALKFFFFTPPGGGASAEKVFTCRSLDIVAHEAGHAILDALQPNWLLFGNPPQTGGLHEAFGDLTSVFLVLSQLDQVEHIIAETKADLHFRNVLSAMGEQFGSALGRPNGLRNLDNDLKLSQVSNEVHDISKVFTGGVYDVLADAFTASRHPRTRDDAEVLYDVGSKMAALTIQAFDAAPSSNASFADVATAMIDIAEGRSG